MRLTLIRSAVLVGYSLLMTAALAANPTSRQPLQPIDTHETIAGAQAEAERLYRLYQSQEQSLLAADRFSSQPEQIPAAAMAKLFAAAWQAGFAAKHLALMGEPTGDELDVRFELIQEEAKRLCQAYRGTPKGANQVPRILQRLKDQLDSMNRFLRQARAALKQEDFEAFERAMLAKGRQLQSLCVFLTIAEQKPYWAPFAAVLKQGMSQLSLRRKQKYLAMLNQEVSQDMATAAGFAPEIVRIRDQIAETGSADLGNGRQGNAAAAFARIVELWGHATNNVNRAVVRRWAFTGKPNANIKPTPQTLQKDATNTLISLIEAGERSTRPSDIPAIYTALLREIAIADRRCASKVGLANQCGPAMQRLAAKHPSLPEQVSAYQRATQQPLKWRRKFAEQRAKFLASEYTALQKLLYAKRQPSQAAPGIRRRRSASLVVAQMNFGMPANWMVEDTAAQVMGRKVIGENALRLKPNSRTMLVPLKNQCYINSVVPPQSEDWVSDLKRSLILNDQFGPLSMEAADAVSSAVIQDYLSIGGVVREVHLEALMTRIATLPDSAYMLYPLGEPLALPGIVFPRKMACWRLDIQPAWVHNKYYAERIGSPLR